MEKRFYQFTKTPLPIACAKLAERVNAQGKTLNIVVNADMQSQIDDALWVGSEFLPHSTENSDGVSKILISNSPQNSDISFLLGDLNFDDIQSSLICYLFQSQDSDIVSARRADWKNFKGKGEFLTYWAENENGQWVKQSQANAPAQNPD